MHNFEVLEKQRLLPRFVYEHLRETIIGIIIILGVTLLIVFIKFKKVLIKEKRLEKKEKKLEKKEEADRRRIRKLEKFLKKK